MANGKWKMENWEAVKGEERRDKSEEVIVNSEVSGGMKFRYRADDEMKDSGVEWLGRIPKEWQISKAKYLLNNLDDKRIPLSGEERGGMRARTYDYYGASGVIDKVDSYIFDDELILVGEDGANLISRNTPLAYLAKGKFGVNNHAHILKPKKGNVNYFVNALENTDYSILISGSAQPKLTQENLMNIPVLNPDGKTQNKIAKFLDEKMTEFDSIISKKEALIEKLEEAKKSLISEVVTGKVKVVKSSDGYELVERKKEEMKNSGVEWVTLIPNEWDLKRSNYVFKFSKGLSITKENLQDEGIPCINYGEIHSKYGFEVNPQKHKLKCVSEEYLNSSPNSLIKYGDFIFADTSEDIKGCGNFSYLNAKDSIFAGYHTVIARPFKEVSSRYLAYLFDSDDWRVQIRIRVSGIKVFSITQSILKTTKVILPTSSEQKLIVDYLDNKFASINSMINNMKKQIEKLKEAKQSLISEVVTGKIEI